MSRIIGGAAGGRRLAVPATGTRPTSDRVRESVFSRLEHLGVLAGAEVLDLYAGSGALGLEAISRGAARAVLVDSSRTAAATCRSNAQVLGFADRVTVLTVRVEALLAGRAPTRTSTLVFLDPPYELGVEQALRSLVRPGWLHPEAVVVVETSARRPPVRWPRDLVETTTKTYGETRVHFAEPSADAGEGEESGGAGVSDPSTERPAH